MVHLRQTLCLSLYYPSLHLQKHADWTLSLFTLFLVGSLVEFFHKYFRNWLKFFQQMLTVSWNSSINTTVSNFPYILITFHEHGGHYYTWVSKQSTTTEFELCYMCSDWPKACQASQWHWRSPIQCFTTPVPKPAVRAVSIIPLHQEASNIRVPTGILKINIT